jgi:hypothetical protein
MKGADNRSIMLVLRDWLDGDDSDRCTMLLAEYVIEKALSGHFGFFRFVLERRNGKLHPTAEEEETFEADCVLVVADDERDGETAKAA